MLLVFTALLLVLAQSTAPARPGARLVFEGAERPHVESTDTHVELRSGSGWLRIPHVFMDVEVTCEFRLADRESVAELVLHDWATGEIRVRLPSERTKPEEVLQITGERPSRQAAAVPALEAGAWHRVRVRAAAGQLQVALGRETIGQYPIGQFAGAIVFRTRKGRVQLRA